MEREDLIRWGIAAGVASATWALGWLVSRFGLELLARLMRRTRTDLDDALLKALRPHVPFWFLVLGVVLGIRYGHPAEVVITRVDRGATAALLLSLSFALASFLTYVVEARARRWPEAVPATTLTQNAVRIVVIGLGALVVLGNLGIAITPILTALGVGSLAVALALQPTLSNLFAGFHVTLARKIRVGDYIELETGQQGFVVDIGWRSTEIRELPNNLIIVPNARISEIIVKNYAFPDVGQSVPVEGGVAYGSDLEEVERVTLEVARDVQRTVEGADPDHEPRMRFHTFADSSVNFKVILRVKEFPARFTATHEFLKRLHRRYGEAGIEIPFPQRVVHMAEVPGGSR